MADPEGRGAPSPTVWETRDTFLSSNKILRVSARAPFPHLGDDIQSTSKRPGTTDSVTYPVDHRPRERTRVNNVVNYADENVRRLRWRAENVIPCCRYWSRGR